MSEVILSNNRVTKCKVLRKKNLGILGVWYLTRFTVVVDSGGLAGSEVAEWMNKRRFIKIDERELVN